MSAFRPGRRPTRPAPPAPPGPLLTPRDLIAAISGRIEGSSPLVAWARELGDLHASLLPAADPRRRPRDFDAAAVRSETGRLIAAIDTWANAHLPCTPHARRHPHTLGQVVSHVAATFAAAWWTVRHSDDEEERHHAWTRLGELHEGYAELVADLEAKRVRLPSVSSPAVTTATSRSALPVR